MWLIGRISSATATIFLSFLLATFSVVAIGITQPSVIREIQSWADVVERWITNTSLPDKYNIWLTFLVDDATIVFLFFTILARIVIAVLLSSLGLLFKRRDTPGY